MKSKHRSAAIHVETGKEFELEYKILEILKFEQTKTNPCCIIVKLVLKIMVLVACAVYIYVGIGFSFANVIIMETDTTESISAALDIRKSFDESTPKSTHCKPISTIIYTHFHPDIDNASNLPNIYAHPYALEELTRIFSIAASVNNIRSMRQFGTLLNEIDKLNPNKNLFENSGIGSFLKFGDQYQGFITVPNILLNQDFTQLIIDNIKPDIYFAPDETRDQIFIYLPEKRVLLPAGEENISNLLRDYRDGTSLVHDQTVPFLNKGLYPEEIIPSIHMNMPQRLKEHPYLQEFYGTIDWSVRGIFDSYLGWFSGDAADLYPLSKIKSAKYLLELMNNDYQKLLLIANKLLFKIMIIVNHVAYMVELLLEQNIAHMVLNRIGFELNFKR